MSSHLTTGRVGVALAAIVNSSSDESGLGCIPTLDKSSAVLRVFASFQISNATAHGDRAAQVRIINPPQILKASVNFANRRWIRYTHL